MKKVLLIAILLVVIFFIVLQSVKSKVKQDLARPIPFPTATDEPPTPTKDVSYIQERDSLFVPYWTLNKNQKIDGENYKEYIYFGITPSASGIYSAEQGVQQIPVFITAVPDESKKILAVRMIDSSVNSAILKNKNVQQQIIKQTITLAKQNGFQGVLLDLEMSALPFDSIVNQITSFDTTFAQSVKQNNLTFAVTLYGDVFYRLRPFDVKAIGRQVDNIYVMAYDFSKAKSDPGPNFPLNGKDTYGYDMTKLVEDLRTNVPERKIIITFGFFGYDWRVNSQGKALQQGKAVTSKEAQKNFIDNCTYKNCIDSRDTASGETEVHYTDSSGNHIIWFEDQDSVAAKKEYLKQQGIASFSYWAYSYF